MPYEQFIKFKNDEEHIDKTVRGERALLAAIVSRAVIDATLNRADALRWLVDESSHLWSFTWICSELELDPENFRTFVKSMMKKGKKLKIRNRQPAHYK